MEPTPIAHAARDDNGNWRDPHVFAAFDIVETYCGPVAHNIATSTDQMESA